MGNPVPYTRFENLSEADLEYLGARIAKGPKVAELLQFGKVQNDVRQLVDKLDTDSGLVQSAQSTGDNANSYSQAVLDEPSEVNP